MGVAGGGFKLGLNILVRPAYLNSLNGEIWAWRPGGGGKMVGGKWVV